MNKEELNQFSRNNQMALLLYDTATNDYLGCRCCLLNGLLAGLVLGQQAVEKILKSILLFNNKTISPRSFSHSLSVLVSNLEKALNVSLKEHESCIIKLQKHYNGRYPDNKNASDSATTEEIIDIDNLILDLIEIMPVSNVVKYKSGIYARAFASVNTGIQTPEEVWLLKANPRLNDLKAAYMQTITE